MSRQIQIRRGSAAEHSTFTGAIGEITMDTTNKTLRVHDGETAGGTPLARADELTDLESSITQNVMKKILPDWSAVVDQNINTDYTAAKNGYLLVYYDDYDASSTITINGSTYTINAIATAPAGASSGSICIPVAAGDTYRYSPARAMGTIATYIKFIPCQE